MDLQGYLTEVAKGYETTSMHSPGHALLHSAASEITPLLPAGLIVKASGGKGLATSTPWIGIFDPDETDSPQHGVYLVYIYSADMHRVVLTLNQGVTELLSRYPSRDARSRLAMDAAAIREKLDVVVAHGLLGEISFSSSGRLQRAYEAGNIVAISYDLASMPPAPALVEDLGRMIDLYGAAIAIKRSILMAAPGVVSSSSSQQTTAAKDLLRDFAPKDDADYVSHLSGNAIVKTRRHETLVREYGELAKGLDLCPATNVHPRDLTLVDEGVEWLVEAKVVYAGNATNAVRDAIGQLL
ncbi:MrcB family domain-containing protein, partial [Lapillicoccus sp.]|uniref:MrcB family domain-containing protein n=1 Tax=Lapillicoccus sp. TaxID=1909287 RepID=UPI003983D155